VKPYNPDESHIGVWLWIVLIVTINAEWIAMDVWLRANGHEYLTTEFREGLRSEWLGPLLCFLVAGSVAAFIWHMWRAP
jgi:hypothetical protein